MTKLVTSRKYDVIRQFVMAAVLIAAACQECAAQTDTTTIALDSSVAGWLSQLADTAVVEHMACLVGSVQHDTVYVDYAYEPLPYAQQTPIVVATNRACSRGSIGFWHIHLPIAPETIQGGAKPVRIPPQQACYFSTGDTYMAETEAALHSRVNYLFQMVQVDKQTACWWLVKQILKQANGERVTIMPYPGQTTWH